MRTIKKIALQILAPVSKTKKKKTTRPHVNQQIQVRMCEDMLMNVSVGRNRN